MERDKQLHDFSCPTNGTTHVLVVPQGLLDLAFDPQFSSNNFFYISHTINLGDDVSSSCSSAVVCWTSCHER